MSLDLIFLHLTIPSYNKYMGTINTPPSDDWFEAIKKAELSEKIERAKASALPRGELDKLQEEEDAITAQFLAGKLTSMQCELKFSEIKSKLDHIVIFLTEADFRRALELLDINSVDFEEALTHELAHFNVARQRKLKSRFCLKFFTEGDRLGFVPGIRLMIEPDNSDDRLRNDLRDVTLAPVNLSESDKRSIQING